MQTPLKFMHDVQQGYIFMQLLIFLLFQKHSFLQLKKKSGDMILT